MKKKMAVLSFCFSLLVAISVGAIAVQQGTLQAISPDSRTVTIDQQRYQLMPDAPVYRASDPDVRVPLTAGLTGVRVQFDLRQAGEGEPLIVYLMIIDQ